MLNKCPHCMEAFSGYADYQEHLALTHLKPQDIDQSPWDMETPKEVALPFARVHSSGRTDLGKQPYRGPMSLAEKARIIKVWESRQKQGAIIS